MPAHYDALFRRLFENPQVGSDFARHYLPAEYQNQIDFESAAIDRDTYIDDVVRRNYTDLLYRFDKKAGEGPLYLYLLYDHKSSPDKWVSIQLLRYIMLIYKKELEKKHPPKILPEVFPVVFYHGTEEWTYSLQCADSIDALHRAHVPHFEPLLFDLNRIDDKRLLGSVQTVVGLLSLKYIKYRFSEDLVSYLLKELHRLPRESTFLHEFYMTLLKFKAEDELQTFLQMAREMNYRDMEEDIMTREQRLLKEGRQEGRNEGRVEGLQDSLKRQLKKKFGLDTEESVKINQVKDPAKLEAALDEILSAETKQQVLEKLGL
ncbi:MAG: Rpn family recombination-promoting nuclease/putative transposase [Spirochaetota bacterium]